MPDDTRPPDDGEGTLEPDELRQLLDELREIDPDAHERVMEIGRLLLDRARDKATNLERAGLAGVEGIVDHLGRESDQ